MKKVEMSREDLRDYIGYLEVCEGRDASHLEAILNQPSLFEKIKGFIRKITSPSLFER